MLTLTIFKNGRQSSKPHLVWKAKHAKRYGRALRKHWLNLMHVGNIFLLTSKKTLMFCQHVFNFVFPISWVEMTDSQAFSSTNPACRFCNESPWIAKKSQSRGIFLHPINWRKIFIPEKNPKRFSFRFLCIYTYIMGLCFLMSPKNFVFFNQPKIQKFQASNPKGFKGPPRSSANKGGTLRLRTFLSLLLFLP